MASQTQPTVSNFPLPLELRNKIMRELLVDPDKPIAVYPNCDITRAIWVLKRPMLKRPGQDSLSYMRQFQVLSQVSRDVREEAQAVFFEQNEWRLEIRLAREYIVDRVPGQHFSEWKKRRGGIIGTDTVTFVKYTWGDHALGRMRNVHLLIHERDPMIEDSIKQRLEGLVQAFQRGGNLKRLSVELGIYYTVTKLGGGCGNPKSAETKKIRECSRLEDGSRGKPITDKYLEPWAVQERILEPIKELRGLKQAVVFGSVTDKWALWLERCMMSNEAVVPDFEQREDISV